ncbi:MAG: N-formylglutamate amidohydrolase [Candidatus Parcubacteria bacterium]|nr:N-formylglutamate amidohydrolase [Burkholderiales bacterium]
MNGVLEVRGPAEAAFPLVLDSPHSGHAFPDDFGAAVSESELREGEDSFVDELYAGGPELGAPLLAALWPRTYLDPNRHAGDVDLELVEGDWPGEYRPSGKARVGKALVWRTLEDGRPIYSARLPAATIGRRIEKFHVPYHRQLKALLDDTRSRFGRVYHINCHSMRAVAGRQSEDQGKPRADFVLGDRDGSSCDPAFTEFVRETLAGMGYQVKVNDPYKGVELVRAFSNPKTGRHSLQIEINKRLYMDEAALRKTAAFPVLQKNLSALLDEVKAFV